MKILVCCVSTIAIIALSEVNCLESSVTESLDSRLFNAAYQGNIAEVNTLLAQGANVNAINIQGGQIPLHEATRGVYSGKNYVDVIKTFLAAGANVDAQDMDGQTPLHWAASTVSPYDSKKIALMHAVWEAKANLPSLYLAAYQTSPHEKENIAIIKTLLNAGANVHITDRYGKTALHLAVRFGCFDKIKLFLEAGANANAVDNDKNTLLHEAARYKNIGSVSTLLEAGASVNSLNNEGNTPLATAVQYGYGENFVVVEMLAKARKK
jgi:ankyrin repeat protein